MSGLCAYCQKRPVSRARGLCNFCYFLPHVRDLYPLAESKYSKWAQEGWLSANLEPGVMPEPTLALPGSLEKQAVLAARFAAGTQLYHPQDAKPEEP